MKSECREFRRAGDATLDRLRGPACIHAGREDPALPDVPATLYRPGGTCDSPLYRLVDACYDEVKGRWEEDVARR
jgi:hypothetical protein